MRKKLNNTTGQMTIELAVVFPVVIIVATIALNALQFFAICAAFDRASHQAIRVYATSPSYGSNTASCCSRIEQSLQNTFDDNGFTSVSVSCTSKGFDLVEFKARVEYAPNLFGLGLKGEVFGVSLPRLTHMTSLTVDNYRPGIVV